MQALFYMDMCQNDSQESLESYGRNFLPSKNVRPFFHKLVKGVTSSKTSIDTVIEQFSSNWKIHRMPYVDRNILRIAVFEILYCADIPVKVSINEAIDIGKKYGTHESGAFINGILDGIRIASQEGKIQLSAPDDKDSLERRCPRLGGPVPLKYCRSSGDDDLPCFKIRDCWWEYFDIQSYLERTLSEAELQKLLQSKPPSKIASIVELIEKAQKKD